MSMICWLQNLSQKTIAKYYKSEDYISHTDSKKSLFDKVYQSVKNITLKRKLKLIINSSSSDTF